MNKFSKLFAAMLLVSSVAAFAMEEKKENLANNNNVSSSTKKSRTEKAAAFATAGKEKAVAAWGKFSNVFVTGNTFKADALKNDATWFAKSKYYTQNTVAFVAPKAAAVAVAYGVYKLYKNYKNVEDADLFEDDADEESAE